MRLVVIRNVPGICSDKIDADCAIDIVILMLKSRKLIPHYFATYFHLTAHFMTDAISSFLLCAASHTLSLSLCLSAILLSSPPSHFDIKMLSDDFVSPINIRIPFRTVLISKVTSIRKMYISL